MRSTLYRMALIGAAALFTVVVLGRQAVSNPAAARGAQARGGDARISALLKERRDLLRQIETIALTRYKQGNGTLEELNSASSAAIRAELDLPHSRAERIALRQDLASKTQEFEKLAEARHNAGAAVETEVDEARVAHINAEIDLEREKSSRARP